MLKKRNLPACAKIPGVYFDLDKVKEQLSSLDGWGDVYETNSGITKFHDQKFIEALQTNDFREHSFTTLRPEFVSSDVDLVSLGSRKSEIYRNKHFKTEKLSPVGNEMNWDYPAEGYAGSYIQTEIARQFKAESCRVRMHWLVAGKTIEPHIDYDPSYGVRFVLPVAGTSGVINAFWPNNKREEYNLAADGSVYFLNTGYVHSVEHNGIEDRIALLFTLKSQEDIECIALK